MCVEVLTGTIQVLKSVLKVVYNSNLSAVQLFIKRAAYKNKEKPVISDVTQSSKREVPIS